MLREAAIFLFVPIAVFGGPAYTVQVIPPPSGLTFVQDMVGINTSGQVTGYGLTGYNGHSTQAFIGSPSGSALIPLPPGITYSEGDAINDAGQVVSFMGNSFYAGLFLSTPPNSTFIPAPNIAIGGGINDSGQVTGSFALGSDNQAFIGTTTGITLIPLLPGWANVFGWAINNKGQVAGTVNNVMPYSNQAFIGSAAGISLVPLPSGWASSNGVAINDSGQVVGYGTPTGGSSYFAFIGTSSGSSAIPPPPGTLYFSQVSSQSINNQGIVVGFSDRGGWIWDAANGTRLLNDSVPAGWTITNAISISNNGLILAQGSLNGVGQQYVELVPTAPTTPAPAAWLLVITGLGLLALFKKLAPSA
jgi:hypothetical protein